MYITLLHNVLIVSRHTLSKILWQLPHNVF